MDMRASRRFFSEPRKNSPSVRMESAQAPAACSDCASSTGSNGSRITPREGERSEEHTSELQSRLHLVCRLLLEKKKTNIINWIVFLTLYVFTVLRLCFVSSVTAVFRRVVMTTTLSSDACLILLRSQFILEFNRL